MMRSRQLWFVALICVLLLLWVSEIQGQCVGGNCSNVQVRVERNYTGVFVERNVQRTAKRKQPRRWFFRRFGQTSVEVQIDRKVK